jgi:hypothetical protein
MDSVAISEVDPLMNAVLNKAEKNVPYGDLVGTRECINTDEVSHKQRSL